ncbi:hypothetical protein PRNP1_006701 [Phytophthora ramorum]
MIFSNLSARSSDPFLVGDHTLSKREAQPELTKRRDAITVMKSSLGALYLLNWYHQNEFAEGRKQKVYSYDTEALVHRGSYRANGPIEGSNKLLIASYMHVRADTRAGDGAAGRPTTPQDDANKGCCRCTSSCRDLVPCTASPPRGHWGMMLTP